MRKYKTMDGYSVYKIKKDDKYYFLGDKNNYKKNIDDILDNIDDLKFDSIIIIFGSDTGEYIDKIKEHTCKNNKILIFEPNKEVFLKNKGLSNDKLAILLFDEKEIRNQLYSVINISNFNNLYVSTFGNYEEIYKQEYAYFIENLDLVFYTSLACISIANRFREEFISNFICNLNSINESTSINSCEEKNSNVPAFIVSAGPSLEKNINDMVDNKDLIEKSVVISGSRTLKTLLNNGIKPDYLLSIDPVDYNYEMIKENLESDIPLAFYEYSNRKILREYKGEKIYLVSLLSKILEEFHSLRGTYLGGSVAHTCVDMARALGCNPIILVGQDCAYTYDKYHSKETTFEFDKEVDFSIDFTVDDVYGNPVKTDATLNQFRIKLEEYIKFDVKENGTRYINASYGADIAGAEHLELSEVFKLDIFNEKKYQFKSEKDISIDIDDVIDRIFNYISVSILGAKEGIDICESLEYCDESISIIDLEDDDERLLKILRIIEIISGFEQSPDRVLLGGYFDKFTFDIKYMMFSMLAKDYDKLTSNLKYQNECFKVYFEEMEKMLNEVEKVVNIAILECKGE